MVDLQRYPYPACCRFVLRPNRSLSWRGTLIFFLGLCLVSGMIALTFALLGYWMVLPFTGLELLAVGWGLYVVSCRCHECEVILVSGETLRIERGRTHPRQCWAFQSPWVQVLLEKPHSGRGPSRLVVRACGESVEIGHFLNEAERRRVAAELIRVLPQVEPHPAG